jgi:hypothetical protein
MAIITTITTPQRATLARPRLHGTDRDDQVRERGGNVAGQIAQPEKDLSKREHRQVKGVIRRVADDPPV